MNVTLPLLHNKAHVESNYTVIIFWYTNLLVARVHNIYREGEYPTLYYPVKRHLMLHNI